MSKGNFATGTMSGKLGAYVFMRRKGEQITRSWVKPADAKTESQGKQRSTLSNIIRMYQCASGFFASAFENKPVKQSDYNALVSRNLRKAPYIYISKEMAAAGGGVVAPYIISDGSLQPIIVTGIGVAARTNIAVGASFEINDTTTVAQLSAVIVANNTFIQEGDQLSYLSIEQFTYGGYPRLRSRKYEMRINSNDPTLVYDVMPVQAVNVVGGYLGHGEFVYAGAFAWVLSRVVNSSVKVSKQSLIVTDNSLYTDYSSGDAATRAAGSYNDTKTIFLDPNSQAGGSVTPSNLPSVAQVKIDNFAIYEGLVNVDLGSSGTIDAGAFVAIGSHLGEVTRIMGQFTGKSTAEGTPTTKTVTFPVTVASETQVSNTEAITLTGIKLLTKMILSIGGEIVYTWTGKDENDNPLG